MSAVKALVFDLYGTLIHLDERPFQRGISRLITAERREWIEFLRDVLVIRAYASGEEFVDAIFARFPPQPGLALVDGHRVDHRQGGHGAHRFLHGCGQLPHRSPERGPL